jgi:predicted O-methyltransferase YrrM
VGKVIVQDWALPLEHASAIAALLFVAPPRHALEWGSGASTRLIRRATPDLVSVDHDPGWAEATGAKLLEQRDEYVGWPTVHAPPGGWDFVLVDGRWRSRCLRAIRPYVSQHGVVALHDAERRHYRAAADEYAWRCTMVARDGRELWLLRP